MSTATTRKKKSDPLAKEEVAALKQFVKKFNYIVDCAEAIGIGRVVLDRVLMVGSGSPETIEKIRSAIKKDTEQEIGEVTTEVK
jgi:hypothetical protein